MQIWDYLVKSTFTVLKHLRKSLINQGLWIVELLPNILVGILTLMLIAWFAKQVRHWVTAILDRRYAFSFAQTIGEITRWTILTFGIFLFLSIVSPSVTPATFLGGLGVSTVAVGFAFKDILQNFLARILLILREPFKIGDRIAVKEFSGVVIGLDIRETRLKLDDNRMVIIPNYDVYASPITVFK